MTPTHREGIEAAKHIAQANAEGRHPDVRVCITMSLYHLSCLMRDIPEGQRMSEALRVARQLVANTRESLD